MSELTQQQGPMSLLSQAIEKGTTIDQLERLMDLQERWEAKQSEKAFNEAMSACQAEIKPISADKENKQTRSKYAGIVSIDKAIREIYTNHGFSISFNTLKSELPDHVLVTALVMHSAGHSKLFQIDIPADGKGARGGDVMTKTHATMAATTYGQRGLIKMIFNIATGEFDDDGNAAAGLSKEDLDQAKLNKIVDLSAELSDLLTPEEAQGVAKVVRENQVSRYKKTIEFLESKRPKE